MSVIFQLFRAEDLEHLTPHQLEGLGKAVGELLDNEPAVLDTVRDRANEVFNQLTRGARNSQPAIAAPQQPGPPRGMLFQLFNQADLEQLTHQQLQILAWAIDCELTHNPDTIVAIRDQIYNLFQQYTRGQHPIIGPDVIANYHLP